MKNKKLITMLTAFCLVFTSIFGGASAIAYGTTNSTADITSPLAAVETTTAQPADRTADAAVTAPSGTAPDATVLEDNTTYIRDPETGYIYPAEEQPVPESVTATANPEGRNRSSLPAIYPPGEFGEVTSTYPPTRKQSPYGTCWSHAVVACSEFDLVKNHGYSKSLDLSELQLAYFTYHTANDKLGNLDGDYNYIPSNAIENYLDMGGSMSFALQTLAQWKGLAYESAVPYTNAESSLRNGIAETFAQKNDGAKLENAYILDIKNNPSAVKEAIRTYGAVDASYYHDSQYYSLNGYALYYCSKSGTGTNHDIAIVGWNDNLPASAFPSGSRPSRNGAWLIRNSWSTNNNGSEYCYFWMSYDDKSLDSTVYAFDFVPGTKYANIYQHDGTTAYGSISVEKAANVFTAKNPDGAGSEVLQAVMLTFMSDADVSYQIDIYTGLESGTTTDPESGYHHGYATTTGTTTHAGVRTIYLKEPVYLTPGEKYAIVVTSKSGQKWFTTEKSNEITYQHNGATVGWFTSTAETDAGESFYKSRASNSSWTDSANDSNYNYGSFRIKGLTVNSSAKKYTVRYNLNGGTVESGNPDWYFSTTSSIALKTPTKEGYHFLGWYAEDTNEKVTSLSGSLGRNLSLVAKYGTHSYEDQVLEKATATEQGWLRKQCTGCSLSQDYYILIPSAKLLNTKFTYDGAPQYPTAAVTVNGGNLSSSLYTVSYSNNVNVGLGKVTIKMDETYYDCTFEEEFSIVPKAAAGVTAKLNGDYNDVKVTWKKSTGADGYYVYYKKASASGYSTKNRAATTKLTTTFKNLNNGTKYTFKVVPYFQSGSKKYTAINANTATATTLKKVVQKTPQKASSTKVKIRWNGINGESGYQIYKMKKSGSSYKKVKSYTTTKSYINVSASKGTTYWYKVRAYKTVGTKKIYGPWSDLKKYKL